SLPMIRPAQSPDRLELFQGTLDLLILRTLRWGPIHGHGIAKFIEQSSREVLQDYCGRPETTYGGAISLDAIYRSDWAHSASVEARARGGIEMSLQRFFARLSSVPKREEAERELNDEIRAHLEMEEAEQYATGLRPDEARNAARRAFGNVTLAKETSREMWIFRRGEEVLQNVRYALRQMRRSPGFTPVA